MLLERVLKQMKDLLNNPSFKKIGLIVKTTKLTNCRYLSGWQVFSRYHRGAIVKQILALLPFGKFFSMMIFYCLVMFFSQLFSLIFIGLD